MMRTRTEQVVFVLGLLSVLTLACEEKPPLKLTTNQRDEVDTLYLRAINKGGLAAEMDSLCKAKREVEIKVLVDSMLRVRREEEEELRLRYSK